MTLRYIIYPDRTFNPLMDVENVKIKLKTQIKK